MRNDIPLPENLKCTLDWIFFQKLHLIFPIGADDTPGSIFPGFMPSSWTVTISYGSLKSSQVLLWHWGQVAALVWDGAVMKGFWPGLRWSAFLLELAPWFPSVCSRITDKMSILLPLQAILVYSSINSFSSQWVVTSKSLLIGHQDISIISFLLTSW